MILARSRVHQCGMPWESDIPAGARRVLYVYDFGGIPNNPFPVYYLGPTFYPRRSAQNHPDGRASDPAGLCPDCPPREGHNRSDR